MSRNLVKSVTTIYKLLTTKPYSKANLYRHIIEKAMEVASKDPGSGEAMAFYSVILENFRYKMLYIFELQYFAKPGSC